MTKPAPSENFSAAHPAPSLGAYLREWRQRRRMSQLDLACEAEISTRHLSFLETGRSAPSREMVLRLADRLNVPVRERNMLLLAAGFAPVFRERRFEDPDLSAARAAVEATLASQKPYPAFALDRGWRIVASNGALPQLYDGVAAELLEPPINVMRLSLHPRGLAPRIVNYSEWSSHLLHRLRVQIEATADPELMALSKELSGYVAEGAGAPTEAADNASVLVPLRLSTPMGVISLITTTMVFGSPTDVTLAELAIELFFPADPETAERVRQWSALER